MADEKDPLGAEVSVEAELTEKGLGLKSRSRALAALDRLVGNLIDIPGAYVERATRHIRARTDTDVGLIRAEGNAAIQKLPQSPDAGDRVLETFRKERERAQRNKDAVAFEAIEQLKALPSPETVSGVEKEELDEDWMNIFSGHAERASSDRLRSLWGRILAGEIRKPGSFSLTTMRIVSELDAEIATLFEKYCRARTTDGNIPKPPGNLGGLVLKELLFLEEVGLLQDVTGSVGVNLHKADDGFHLKREGAHLLRVKMKSGKKARVSWIPLTRVGRELTTILPAPDAIATLTAIADQLREKAESVEIATIISELPGNQVAHSPFRSI